LPQGVGHERRALEQRDRQVRLRSAPEDRPRARRAADPHRGRDRLPARTRLLVRRAQAAGGRRLRAPLARWFTRPSSLGLRLVGGVALVFLRSFARAQEDRALVEAAKRVIDGLLAADLSSAGCAALKERLAAGDGDGFCALRSESGKLLATWNARAP